MERSPTVTSTETPLSDLDVPVLRCVAKFVRDRVLCDATREEIVNTLKAGQPYVLEEAVASIVMIDISGYSQLTNINLDRAIEDQRRLGGGVDYVSLAKTKRETTLTSPQTANSTYESGDPTTSIARQIQLKIHVGLTCGSIEHCIFGNMEERLEYVVSGSCMSNLGLVLDAAKGGELGVDVSLLEYSSYIQEQFPKNAIRCGPGYVVLGRESLVDLLRGMESSSKTIAVNPLALIQSPEPKLYQSNNGYPTLNATLPAETILEDAEYCSAAFTLQPHSFHPDALPLLGKFVNQSLLKKLSATETARRVASKKRAVLQPTIPGSSDTSVQLISAEYRNVAILFVKIDCQFSSRIAQRCLSKFSQILKKHEGVFQQFSVDDKGQTMLACFGLPPWTHEKEPLNALRAAVEFSQYLQPNSSEFPFAISVTFGELFYSMIGNAHRSDASLLGDVVNIAARLLNIPSTHSNVRCDKATYNATRADFHHVEEGYHNVKGKSEALQVWAVQPKSEKVKIQENKDAMGLVGYRTQRSVILESVERWYKGGCQKLVVVEGGSGTGKSRLGDYVEQELVGREILYCSIQGTEINRYTPYSAIQNIIQFIFRRHSTTSDLPSTDKPPTDIPSPPAAAGSESILSTSSSLRASTTAPALRRMSQRRSSFLLRKHRPLEETKGEVLMKMVKSYEIIHVVLLGFSVQDTEEFLKNKFGSMESFQTIDSEVVNSIHEQSGGVPLALDEITESLKTCFDTMFHVRNDHLYFAGPDGRSQVEKVVSVGATTLLAFDRLDPVFQDILKGASILGKYFNLLDLSILLPGLSPADIDSLISTHDTLPYLLRQPSETDEAPPTFSFRNQHIMNAIYDAQPFAERSESHALVAATLEETLTPSNRDFALPIVAFHYLRSDRYGKQIMYLEELGLRYVENAHFAEGVNSLETLLHVSTLSKIDVDAVRKATWMGKLAHAHIETKNFYVKALVVESLKLLGHPWPGDPKATKKSLGRSLRTLFKFWVLTNGGTRPVFTFRDFFSKRKRKGVVVPSPPTTTTTTDKRESDRQSTLLLNYGLLFKSGLYGGTLTESEVGLAMLSFLHTLIHTAHENKVDWTGFLFIAAFGLSWINPTISCIFFKKALEIEKTIVDKEPLHGYLHTTGLKHLQMGELEEAERALRDHTNYFLVRGDWSQGIMSLAILQGVYFLQGRFTHRESDFLTASKEESPHHTPLMMALLRSSLVTKNHQETRRRYILTEASYKTVVVDPMYESILLVPGAWICFQQGNLESALEKFHQAASHVCKMNQHLQTILDNILFMVLEGWMLVAPFVPDNIHMRNVHAWNDNQCAKLVEAFANLSRVCEKFGKGFRMPIYEWPLVLFSAAGMYVAHKREKAMGLIIRSLKKKRMGEQLGKMRFFKAIVFSVLGLYGRVEPERERYYTLAKEMWVEFGADYVELWLEQARAAGTLRRSVLSIN
ncbi:hypothetical protein HDV05_002450 [Chytridiales sp. JEL 0842]|nr:hypothetical protein HDV05_002450 [Chytridiales sp. JEL 0842]